MQTPRGNRQVPIPPGRRFQSSQKRRFLYQRRRLARDSTTREGSAALLSPYGVVIRRPFVAVSPKAEASKRVPKERWPLRCAARVCMDAPIRAADPLRSSALAQPLTRIRLLHFRTSTWATGFCPAVASRSCTRQRRRSRTRSRMSLD